MNKEYTREELLKICKKAFVPENKWHNRDSESSQCQLGECYVLLKAGCDFKVDYEDDICKTNENTIWLYVYSKGFKYFEYADDDEEDNFGLKEEHHYYLPTLKKIEESDGQDWY
jgi:hypothetical protein